MWCGYNVAQERSTKCDKLVSFVNLVTYEHVSLSLDNTNAKYYTKYNEFGDTNIITYVVTSYSMTIHMTNDSVSPQR